MGASPYPWRASNVVMAYLLEQGYACVPVNPEAASVLGQPCFATLEEAVAAAGGEGFDIVDVFRRAEHTPDIARSAVALGCGTLWLQQGIVIVGGGAHRPRGRRRGRHGPLHGRRSSRAALSGAAAVAPGAQGATLNVPFERRR